MDRTTGDANVGNMFDPGDPGVPRPPTQVDASWLNDVQEELATLVETAGATLVSGTAQLQGLLANLTVAQTFTAVKAFARGLTASLLSGALGPTVDVTGANGGVGGTGANVGVGQTAVRGTGGTSGGTAVNAGSGAELVGGATTHNSNAGAGLTATGGAATLATKSGPAIRATGGYDGTGYADALESLHGDITLFDGSFVAAGTESSIPAPASTTLSLGAGVAAYAGFGGPGGVTPGVWKDANGTVHLEGTIVAAASSSYTAATLSVGFRSGTGKRLSFGNRSETTGNLARVVIDTNGDILVDADANGVTVALSGITFR